MITIKQPENTWPGNKRLGFYSVVIGVQHTKAIQTKNAFGIFPVSNLKHHELFKIL